MSGDLVLTEITPKAVSAVPTAAQMAHGTPTPPVQLLMVMSPGDWELFTEEWLSFHRGKGTYKSIRRCSGPGDLGLDIVAFTSDAGFAEPWDSFQCKHYVRPLTPSVVCGEVAKVIYHSFRRAPPYNQVCRVPRHHVFVSPKGSGITVARWLKNPNLFKREVRTRWDQDCAPRLGSTLWNRLDGDMKDYFDSFDFSIFEDRTGVELITEHGRTPFHIARFGGGLSARGDSDLPPKDPQAIESVYLRKLLAAYSESLGRSVSHRVDLGQHPDLERHYDRQRELFYSAESLRNFARDRTPPMTFRSLQEDIFHGVIDACEADYSYALARLRETLLRAAQLSVSGNALHGVTRIPDKQGICHQLANDCRLTWTQQN